MLEDFASKFPLVEVIVEKDDRQRKSLPNIKELAGSISRNGLLNPIIIRRPGNILVAGERRYTAFCYLRDQHEAASPGSENPWAAIPFRFLDTLDPNLIAAIELEENTQREQLSWQDRAVALHKIHDLRGRAGEISVESTADFLGMSRTQLSQYLLVAHEINAGNQQVIDAAGLTEAANKVRRTILMSANEAVSKLLSTTGAPSAPVVVGAKGEVVNGRTEAAPAILPKDVEPTKLHPVINADFIEWADKYTGEPFNFLHCDLPYGINHQNSKQGNVADYGAYNDSEDVYWALCAAIARNKKKLLYNSSHIIFWFSMKHYEKTVEFFRKEMPEHVFEDYPLVWHKRQGIAPDPSRRPQRNYETALFGWSMNRNIVQLCSNVINAPPGMKLHASQKSPRALRHFFRLVVNSDTRMLDPTCGSGTSLQAAMALGAKAVVGVELDAKFAKLANEDFAVSHSLGFAKGLEEGED